MKQLILENFGFDCEVPKEILKLRELYKEKNYTQ
jgi:hypothetical protein